MKYVRLSCEINVFDCIVLSRLIVNKLDSAMPDKVPPSGATPSRQSSNVHSVGTNGSGAASTGSSKKNDKKARRAAKVQQKEGSDTPPAATNQPGGAGEATKDNKSPEAAPHVPAEKKQLSKAERRAKQVWRCIRRPYFFVTEHDHRVFVCKTIPRSSILHFIPQYDMI